MSYDFGTGQNQIDPFFERKRSWSTVKDRIVNDYLACYLKTVHSLRKPIVLVDAFSGPGQFGDGTDGSPLLICKAIDSRGGAGAAMNCVFSDTRPAHRAALKSNLRQFIEAGVCGEPLADCGEAIAHAVDKYRGSTIFFYLDPYGIKDLEFDTVRQIYERDIRQSTEVLINFNFRTFMRMSGNWGYDWNASQVAREVAACKAGKIDTVNRVMGGDYWLSIVTNPALNKIDREDAVINAYLDKVRGYFQFAYSIPVKERSEDQMSVPADELAHYHLIFGTRSARAVEYMNDVALNALAPYFRQFSEGLLFDLRPDRYLSAERSLVKSAIVDAVKERPIRRPEIYEAIIPKFFMQYRKKDYRAMLDELVKEGRLHPDPRSVKRPGKLNNDVALSVTPFLDGQQTATRDLLSLDL